MLVAQTLPSLERYRVLFVGALALNLVHCGATDDSSQDDLQASEATSSAGGSQSPSTTDATAEGSTRAGEASSTTGNAGLNISGDWGLFVFEDPVAVNLQQ